MKRARREALGGWGAFRWGVAVVLLLGMVGTVEAARIGDLVDSKFASQAARFFGMRDPSVRNALIGSLVLGVGCGLLGCFSVVRRQALMGDALSHAVLPGVVLGYLWNQTKDPVAIFVGATVAGLLGAGVVAWIQRTTRHKEDAALGFVLASFFAVGICLLTRVNQMSAGQKSGLDKFLFGQAAALSDGDVRLMAGVTVLVVVGILLGYKELAVVSFDPGFSRTLGLPVGWVQFAMTLMLAFVVVVSLQAVGVVLVSAMLITPAAAAYLLTDRFPRMLVLAAVFGGLSGVAGAFFSFVGRSLPTGPVMVLSASAVFGAAMLFAPRYGIVTRMWRERSRAARIRRENTLKAFFHILEGRPNSGDAVSMREIAEIRRETVEDAMRLVRELARHGWATYDEGRESALLTREGWQRACEIVRNHRLWELYLTNAAQVAVDHVHEDAERIEHVLGDETVRQIERRLNFATRDPHGKMIPGPADIHRAPVGKAAGESGRASGFGRG